MDPKTLLELQLAFTLLKYQVTHEVDGAMVAPNIDQIKGLSKRLPNPMAWYISTTAVLIEEHHKRSPGDSQVANTIKQLCDDIVAVLSSCDYRT